MRGAQGMSHEEVEQVMAIFDADRSGSISKIEFVKAIETMHTFNST